MIPEMNGFGFLGHCHAMVKIGPGSFSHVFRKGKDTGTVTVGYYKAEQSEGWWYSLHWQERFFLYLRQGMTFGEAFDEAGSDYPEVEEMVRILGDHELDLDAAKTIREEREERKWHCLRQLIELIVRWLKSVFATSRMY